MKKNSFNPKDWLLEEVEETSKRNIKGSPAAGFTQAQNRSRSSRSGPRSFEGGYYRPVLCMGAFGICTQTRREETTSTGSASFILGKLNYGYPVIEIPW